MDRWRTFFLKLLLSGPVFIWFFILYFDALNNKPLEYFYFGYTIFNCTLAFTIPNSQFPPISFGFFFISSILMTMDFYPNSEIIGSTWLSTFPFLLYFISDMKVCIGFEVIIQGIILGSISLDTMGRICCSTLGLWLFSFCFVIENFKKDYIISMDLVENDRKILITNLVHELRNPLNVVLSCLNMMGELRNDKERKRLLALESTRELERVALNLSLITDFVKGSMVDNMRQTFEVEEEIEISFLIQSIKERLEGLLKLSSTGFEVISHPDLPEMIKGSKTKIQHILEILCSNSIRFANFGDKVNCKKLGLEVSQTNNKWLIFTISDNAQPIAGGQVDRLFAPYFTRSLDTIDNYGDIGLGLWISHDLAKAMGGSLTYKPSPEGNTFIFRLPIHLVTEKSKVDVMEKLEEEDEIEEKDEDNQEEGEEREEEEEEKEENYQRDEVKDSEKEEENNSNTFNNNNNYNNQSSSVKRRYSIEKKPKEDLKGTGQTSFFKKKEKKEERKSRLERKMVEKKRKDHSMGSSEEDEMINTVVKGFQEKEMNVLVVDDNNLNRDILSMMIKKINPSLKPDMAHNGLIALEMASIKTYQLILMDLSMPVMDGHESSRRIRELENGKNVYIACVSGHAIDQHIKEALKTMDVFMAKPLTSTQLSTILWKAYEKTHPQ